ncbi:hypothetical protein AGLY_006570 [Aphis glycines]|uniref:Uncharacterized protein n=1 Tax=Aphis glycines TaxID=307491 RepID=A0A6G0TRG4_APHGL|nr:hypothetical protein AGLY_006570 [Aphis glycines]
MKENGNLNNWCILQVSATNHNKNLKLFDSKSLFYEYILDFAKILTKDNFFLIGQHSSYFIIIASQTYEKSSIKFSTLSYLHNIFYKFTTNYKIINIYDFDEFFSIFELQMLIKKLCLSILIIITYVELCIRFSSILTRTKKCIEKSKFSVVSTTYTFRITTNIINCLKINRYITGFHAHNIFSYSETSSFIYNYLKENLLQNYLKSFAIFTSFYNSPIPRIFILSLETTPENQNIHHCSESKNDLCTHLKSVKGTHKTIHDRNLYRIYFCVNLNIIPEVLTSLWIYDVRAQTSESGVAKFNLTPPPLSWRPKKKIVEISNTNFEVTFLLVTGKFDGCEITTSKTSRYRKFLVTEILSTIWSCPYLVYVTLYTNNDYEQSKSLFYECILDFAKILTKDNFFLIGQHSSYFIIIVSQTYGKSSIKFSTLSYLHNIFYKFTKNYKIINIHVFNEFLSIFELQMLTKNLPMFPYNF